MIKQVNWHTRLKPIFLGLSITALLWVVYILYADLKDSKEILEEVNFNWIAFVFIFNCIANYVGFIAFSIIFNKVKSNTYSINFLGHLFFVAQIMKHLPGRVFGVAYQAVKGNHATLGEWILANSAYMLLNTLFALLMAASVAAFLLHDYLGFLAIILGIILYFSIWHKKTYKAISWTLELIFKSKAKNINTVIESISSSSLNFKVKLFIVFCLSWILYLVAWAGYGIAWPSLTAADGVFLCGIYTLAWFAGYISLISPSGIGVRELVFVYLAKDFPPDAVAGMAILGRMVLLFVDIFIGIIFIGARNDSEKQTN